jgi:hypothetical protein
MAETVSLYQHVVRITYIYLGPAADRFVTRQIANHLHKQPEQLRKADLPELIDWIKLAMGFLTEDQKMIDEYIGRLHTLEAKPKRKVNDRPHAVETV